MKSFLTLLLLALEIFLAQFSARAGETWQDALSRMPLGVSVAELNRTNCLKLLLPAFREDPTVKALVFMPGATDEFYMFRRARAKLTNAAPTLLDAINALTNQTLIQVTFRPPLLLLHTTEDPLEPLATIKDLDTASRIEGRPFIQHALYNDRDWDFLLPILRKNLRAQFLPRIHSYDSFHFYRHSFAGWNLNGWEALQALSLAGKTRFTIDDGVVTFEGDNRFMSEPKFDQFPR
ncbi:MAG TPA: hypothetical protein VH413_09085 [Verrucomicrobiae bacterium]|nr:hypothetical protein [Verrucomicrobiae bacterium]